MNMEIYNEEIKIFFLHPWKSLYLLLAHDGDKWRNNLHLLRKQPEKQSSCLLEVWEKIRIFLTLLVAIYGDSCGTVLGDVKKKWFLLEWHFVLRGSDAHLCNCRFHSHRQWIQHQHWGSCFCTEPAGPLGKQHALGQKQSQVCPLQLLPPSREQFMVSSTLRPLPTYRVVAPLLWQHDIQRWLSILDIVELGRTWWADHSIRAQCDILCPFKGSFHSKGKLLLWKKEKATQNKVYEKVSMIKLGNCTALIKGGVQIPQL